MRNSLILFVATLLIVAQAAIAFGIDVDVDPNCPTDTQAGSSVVVDLHLENNECFEVTFERIFVGIVGNTDDSVGGVGIFGPFARAIPVDPAGMKLDTIDAATCAEGFICNSFFGCPGLTPGRLVLPNVFITDKVPVSLGGTVVAMIVSIEATASVPVPFPPEPNTPPTQEEGFLSGSCLVEITSGP